MTPAAEEGVGGLWSSGGAAVDARGDVYVASGRSVINALAGKGVAGVYPDSAGNWGQSILRLRLDRPRGFRLVGSSTPFNYCKAGAQDVDLGSGAPVLIDVEPRATCTPRLLAPEPQPQFGVRGPLNVFGPYSERFGRGNQAKSRSTGAYFRDPTGHHYLFVTGSQKSSVDSGTSVAPGLARLQIVTAPGQPAHLRLDRAQPELVPQNPGSPVVTSAAGRNAIVWVLDPDLPRSAALYGAEAPQPVLYAIDAGSMALLWRSRSGQLYTSGKYNEPLIVRGTVFVGTAGIEGGTIAAHDPQAAAVAAAASSAALPAPPAEGRMIYLALCAGYHEQQRREIPSRAAIAARPVAFLVEQMTLGSMQSAAIGPTDAQLQALAAWLTSAGGTTDR